MEKPPCDCITVATTGHFLCECYCNNSGDHAAAVTWCAEQNAKPAMEQQLAASRLAGKVEGMEEAAKTAESWRLTIWPGRGVTAYTVKETEDFANDIGPNIASAIRAKITELTATEET
jgi:hypothetical protein